MEDNLAPNEPFAPSIFAQAESLSKEEGLSSIPSVHATPVAFELDEETTKIIVEVPFDVASFISRMDSLALRDTESSKLAKLWRGPLQRLLGKYENSDIGIAAVATLGIAFGKFEEYKLERDRQDRKKKAEQDAQQ